MSTKVITGAKCRSSYMFVNDLELRGKKATTKTVKSAILIPKSDKKTIKAIREAIDAAATASFGKTFKEYSTSYNHPLRDGDKELEMREEDEDGEAGVEGAEYENCYFVNCTGYKVPDVVDSSASLMEDWDERKEVCTSGNYFRFSITAKGYENESKGVRFLLNNLMFIKEGERLDGGKKGEDDFAEYADVEDDDEVINDKPKKKKRLKRKR